MISPPAPLGIHHLKFPVSDLATSLNFYERAFAARRIPEADHRRTADGELYAYIIAIEGLGMLELRLHPSRARRHALFDPLTLRVADRVALTAWIAHLDTIGATHSPVITAVQAWLVVVEDPDGNRIRLYTDEKHGPELSPQENHPWIADPEDA